MSLIVKIGADTRKFNSEIRKLTADIRGVTSELQNAGQQMATALTAPLAGLAAVSGTIAASFSDAQGQIQASLGVTGEEAEKLNSITQNLWKKGFGENIGEAARQVAIVSQNMRNIPIDQLGEVAQQAMTIAKVFGQDISQVTKTANMLMTNFGLSSTEAFDMITKGFQEGLNFSGEFLDTLNEYSPQFKALGFTGDQFFSTLAAGAEAGAFNLDKVGDAVKEFNIRAQDGSKLTTSSFEALGLNATKMAQTFAKGGPEAQKAFTQIVQAISKVEDPVKRNTIGVGLFGAQFEDLEQDVMAAMGTVSDQFSNVEGTTKRAGDAIHESLGERMKSTFRELQAAMEPIGEVLLIMADQIIPKLSTALQGLSDWFSKLSPNTQQFVISLGMILALSGPLLIGIAALVNAFAVVKAALVAVGIASMGAVGIWIVIGIAIAALVAAIIIYWDDIKAITISVWNSISEFMINLWNEIVSIAISVWESIVTFFSGLWASIKDMTEIAWNGIKDFFSKWGLTILAVIMGPIGLLALAIYKNWDTISSFTLDVWNSIKEFLLGIWNSIVSFVTPIFESIVSAITAVWNVISTVTSTVWNFIWQYLVALWTALMYFMIPIFQSIKDFLAEVWNTISTKTAEVWNVITSFLQTVWNGIKTAASIVWNAITTLFMTVLNFYVNLFTTVWNLIKETLATIWNSIKSIASTVWNSIKDTLTIIWNNVKTAASTIWNAISSVIMGPINTVKTMAINAFNNLKQGITNIFNSVKSTALSIWNSIYTSVSSVVSRMVAGVGGAFNGLKSSLIGVWNGIKSGIKSVINGIIGMINKFIDGFNKPAKSLNKIPNVDAPLIPHIPMLATGGTIFGSGQAIVGEAGPELITKSGSSVRVTPLSAGEKARGIGGALGMGQGSVSFSGTIEVPVILDGRTIAMVVAPYMDGELRNKRDSINRARGG